MFAKTRNVGLTIATALVVLVPDSGFARGDLTLKECLDYPDANKSQCEVSVQSLYSSWESNELSTVDALALAATLQMLQGFPLSANTPNLEISTQILDLILAGEEDNSDAIFIYSMAEKNRSIRIQLLKRILNIDPEYFLAYGLLAFTYGEEHEKYEAMLEKAFQHSRWDDEEKLLYASLLQWHYLSSGNQDKFAQLTEEVRPYYVPSQKYESQIQLLEDAHNEDELSAEGKKLLYLTCSAPFYYQGEQQYCAESLERIEALVKTMNNPETLKNALAVSARRIENIERLFDKAYEKD